VTGNTADAAVAWRGNVGLKGMLVSVDELHPHPRNPRRGVVSEIAKSLQRFGQQRPLLALPDGTLVAGHHVWQAAAAEGWSHIAVVRSDLTEQEVEAYLLADNRLADLGLYEDAALAELLQPLAEADALEGIGYTPDDLAQLLAFLEPPDLEKADARRSWAHEPYAMGEAELFRIMLTYDQPTYEAMIGRLDAYASEHDLDSYSEVVRRIILAED
jgi:hypothetical protein